jgi:membrane dipeptidase
MKDQAEAIVRDAFVINGAEIIRCGGAGRPHLMLDPLAITADLVDDWVEEGVDVIVPPLAAFKVDHHAENFRLLAALNAVIARDPRLIRIDDAAGFAHARAPGKIGVIGCIHQGEHFRCVNDVDLFHAYGQRIGLVVSHGQNLIGGPVEERAADGGLTMFGEKIVERMNRCGMAIDISHCGPRTSRDIIEASAAPITMSHANAAALCPNPRNKSDEIIKAAAAKGAVIGVMQLRMMVTPAEPTTSEHVIDHLAYMCDLVGPDHVGLGAEAPREGWDSIAHGVPLPKYMRNEGVQRKLDIPELCDKRRFVTLTEGMLRRGFGEDVIRKILGENFARVFSDIFRGQPPMKAEA